MPLPTTWHPLPDMGAARDQGSGTDPCAHPPVGRLLWCRQFEPRHVRPLPVRHVRRGHVRDRSEDASAASLPRQMHGDCAGQCHGPPCCPAQARASAISHRAHLAVSAAVQPAAGPHRARLEVGPPHGDAQPCLRHPGRMAHRRLNVRRPLEKTQLGAAQRMRHNLRLCV